MSTIYPVPDSPRPVALAPAYQDYLAESRPGSVDMPGGRWDYRAGGRGEETILFLPGSLRRGEVWFPVAQSLAPRYRFVALSPPPIANMEEMVAGCLAVLAKEGIETFHAVGHSFGGMAAQALARLAPERVKSMALFNSAAPAAHNPAYMRWAFTSGLEMAAWCSKAVPDALARWIYPRRLSRTFLSTVSEEERGFWQAFLTRAIGDLGMQDICAVTLVAVPSFFRASTYTTDDLAGWGGRVLLVTAKDDTTMPPVTLKGLQKLYPRATCHAFTRGGHLAPLTRWEP
ncbi:alpha/beta hydrolase, partial [bacterium]|nr:alpha/beta hydrolase [bacterium]